MENIINTETENINNTENIEFTPDKVIRIINGYTDRNNHVIEAEVAEDIVGIMSRHHYEYMTMKDLVATLIDSHSMDTDVSYLFNSTVYKSYHENLIKAYAAYDTAKQQVPKLFTDEINNTIGDHSYDWDLNFGTNILKITIHLV